LAPSEGAKASADTLLDIASLDRSAKTRADRTHDKGVGEERSSRAKNTCLGKAAAKKAQEKG
jgi:hypothetical protein